MIQWTLLPLLSLLVYWAHGQDQNATEECFAHRSLTCHMALEVGANDFDHNLACEEIELTMKAKLHTEVTLLNSEDDLPRYQWSLGDIAIDAPFCYRIQNVFHRCWWCARLHLKYTLADDFIVNDDFCQFKDCAEPDKVDPNLNITAVCDAIEKVHSQGGYPATIEFCRDAEQASHECPVLCDQPYLGASTDAQKKALVWMARASSFLSLLGASYIIYDVLSDKKNRKTVYNQLLLGMATFDISTALAWGFSTAPVPKDKYWIYGAIGNMSTCRAQAFFVQLGFTSIFYNVSLATYYLLVIVYAWREHALVKVKHLLHGVPISIGVVLAFGGIPVYDWFEYGCHLLPPPQGSMGAVLMFAVVPLGLAIASIIVCMSVVYFWVRSQSSASRKWSLTGGGKGGKGGKSSALLTRVFYQSIFYVLSFFISWPILFAMYLASIDTKDFYGLSITIAFVAPLQGFTNFLVYMRPKFNHWRAQRLKKKKPSTTTTSSTGVNSSMNVKGSSGSLDPRAIWRAQLSATTWKNSDSRISSRFSFNYIRNSLRRLGVSSSVASSDANPSVCMDGHDESSSPQHHNNNMGASSSSLYDQKSNSSKYLVPSAEFGINQHQRPEPLDPNISKLPVPHSPINSPLKGNMLGKDPDEDDDISTDPLASFVDPSVLIAQDDQHDDLDNDHNGDYHDDEDHDEDGGDKGPEEIMEHSPDRTNRLSSVLGIQHAIIEDEFFGDDDDDESEDGPIFDHHPQQQHHPAQ